MITVAVYLGLVSVNFVVNSAIYASCATPLARPAAAVIWVELIAIVIASRR